LEDELDGLEEAIFAGTFSQVISARIYDLKRDLVGLKRAVSPLVEVCNRLVRFDVTLIPEDARLYFRDVYDHVIRINETIDNQRELLTTALEANLSLISVRQNEVMKQLGAWGAIIAVPTLIAGIYGMNFEFMPEVHWRWAYPAVGGAMVIACAVLYVRFKRAGWL
ncbi:MAG: magnesium transporter, partial [Deltaproteobacteria bacterium]